MDLKNELKNYQIGGIGDIKKHTLRFHSYGMRTEDGKLKIFAEYESGNPPKVFDGYPSGQELLLDLCNLHLELRNKTLEEAAQILIRWSIENIHLDYRYGDDVVVMEYNEEEPDAYWDFIVNCLEFYNVPVEDMVSKLEQLYNDTMTVFTLRSLIAGNIPEAQRFYENVQVPEEGNLMVQWYKYPPQRRAWIIEQCVDKLPKLTMNLKYDVLEKQIRLEPVVNSVIDAAYYALGRFAAVNAGALDDYGGKTNIAFCQACGRAFIKRGNRQKYCGTMQCQSIRNNRKSSDYYYRKKKEEQDNS